ncbi:MAG: alpha/beta fold hydrolase [Candidatus Geothermincolia bacterium]
MNTADTMRAGMSLVRALVSYYIWLLRPRSGKRGRVRAGDIDIFYTVHGDGDPVLLLHGGFMTSQAWAGQIPALSREYRVIAMDSRGHGRTTLGTMPLTYRQLGRDAAALVESLGVGAVNVIGTSDGGIAGMAMAMERPDLVHSLVLLGTSFNTGNYTPEAWRAIHSFLKPWSPALLGMQLVRLLVNPERRTWRSFFNRMKEMWLTLPDFTPEDLATIECPTLVVGCTRDEFLSFSPDPLAVFKETAAAIPNSRLVVIPGGTHTVNLDLPGTTNNMIEDFYSELPTRFESDFSRATSRGHERP